MKNQGTSVIPALLNCTYNSFEEAYATLQSHGIENDYGFRCRVSKSSKSDIKTRFYYCCDKHDNYQSKTIIRKTSTRTTDCSFSLLIFQEKESTLWKLQVKNDSHNHSSSLHSSAHHVYRKRTQSEKNSIQTMTNAEAASKQITTALHQANSSTFITARDIRNERIAIRANYLEDRSPIEALLDDLSTSEWIFDIKRDSENHIQYLFFAHSKQVELLLANPDVLLMDCIYRINKYRLPLLHILGCISLQTFFSAGFCFLRNETEVDYH
jgi:hypothetical protein